jgi:hypothetical protein
MPAAFAAILPLLTALAPVASLAATGVGLGESLANQPGTPKAPTPSPAVTDANATKVAENQKALEAQQFPSIQQATGGSLAPEAWIQLAQQGTGQAGTPGISGTNMDLLNRIISGGGPSGQVSAGNTNVVPNPYGLSNSTFG